MLVAGSCMPGLQWRSWSCILCCCHATNHSIMGNLSQLHQPMLQYAVDSSRHGAQGSVTREKLRHCYLLSTVLPSGFANAGAATAGTSERCCQPSQASGCEGTLHQQACHCSCHVKERPSASWHARSAQQGITSTFLSSLQAVACKKLIFHDLTHE